MANRPEYAPSVRASSAFVRWNGLKYIPREWELANTSQKPSSRPQHLNYEHPPNAQIDQGSRVPVNLFVPARLRHALGSIAPALFHPGCHCQPWVATQMMCWTRRCGYTDRVLFLLQDLPGLRQRSRMHKLRDFHESEFRWSELSGVQAFTDVTECQKLRSHHPNSLTTYGIDTSCHLDRPRYRDTSLRRYTMKDKPLPFLHAHH